MSSSTTPYGLPQINGVQCRFHINGSLTPLPNPCVTAGPFFTAPQPGLGPSMWKNIPLLLCWLNTSLPGVGEWPLPRSSSLTSLVRKCCFPSSSEILTPSELSSVLTSPRHSIAPLPLRSAHTKSEEVSGLFLALPKRAALPQDLSLCVNPRVEGEQPELSVTRAHSCVDSFRQTLSKELVCVGHSPRSMQILSLLSTYYALDTEVLGIQKRTKSRA